MHRRSCTVHTVHNVQLVCSHSHTQYTHTESSVYAPLAKWSVPRLAQRKRQMLKDTEDTHRVNEAPNPIFSPETTGRRNGVSVQSTKHFEPVHPLSDVLLKFWLRGGMAASSQSRPLPQQKDVKRKVYSILLHGTRYNFLWLWHKLNAYMVFLATHI